MRLSRMRGPVSESSIRESAVGMIAAHGQAAAAACEAAVDKMRQRRDTRGENVWRRILVAVLQAQPRAPMQDSAYQDESAYQPPA